jgi:bacillithiol biosynthesis cysteine-adding enzyme BshC
MVNHVESSHHINQKETIDVSYESTGFFSKLVADYLSGNENLREFYKHPVSIEGIRASIQERKAFKTNRKLLVASLTKQYEGIHLNALQEQNLQSLLGEDTFTITTAHQPNIFTGPLYFIYKILHAIKLANEMKLQLPEYDFVPVYYMGSEDADLDELGYIYLNGEKRIWETNQTGAVGRMKIDKAFLQLIDSIEGQLGIHPFGNRLITVFRECYSIDKTIQQATLELVNNLFASYGLLIVIPDNAALKQSFNSVIKKELEEQFSNKAVSETIHELSKHYKPQAGGRELNLFYLIEDKRERIELSTKGYTVTSLNKNWTLNEILLELEQYPERFSANVILRGVFQETILPNIAFIGGGGELAYWLELKKVFEAVQVPYPMLVLRNSFLLVKQSFIERIKRLGFKIEDFFADEIVLINKLVKRDSENRLTLDDEIKAIQSTYNSLRNTAATVDTTLLLHIDSLQKNALKRINELEKKLLRAEKRKFKDKQHQIATIKRILFPRNSLQERIDNFAPFYAIGGKEWIDFVYNHTFAFEQLFRIIEY